MSEVFVTDKSGSTMLLVDLDGYRICTFYRTAAEQEKVFRNIRNIPCRPDDVFILAPVKSGTHWTWEIVSMLTNGKAEYLPQSKVQNMLEYVLPETIEAIQSPRILNSHVNIQYLPKELIQKRCKIVFPLRNPKDMLVSWYHHVKGIDVYNYDGSWSDFFELFMLDQLEYGNWFQYMLEWGRFIKNNHDYPIHILYYENMKKDLHAEVRRLAVFLETSADDNLIDEIVEKCSFKEMRTHKAPSPSDVTGFKGGFTMYRKGVIGDWKNWFTVSQSERFESRYNEEMKDSGLFKFAM